MLPPDFQAWRRSQPLPPGTRIRLESTYPDLWWHGLETTIVHQSDKNLKHYRVVPVRKDGWATDLIHVDNFVVIEP